MYSTVIRWMVEIVFVIPQCMYILHSPGLVKSVHHAICSNSLWVLAPSCCY